MFVTIYYIPFLCEAYIGKCCHNFLIRLQDLNIAEYSYALTEILCQVDVTGRSLWYLVSLNISQLILFLFTVRLPSNIAPLKEIILLAQGCILLLYLKQHLKDMYGFTDRYVLLHGNTYFL